MNRTEFLQQPEVIGFIWEKPMGLPNADKGKAARLAGITAAPSTKA